MAGNYEKIRALYSRLRKMYGHPEGQWALWCRRPKTDEMREQVIIEAILTQRANWRNVEQAVRNLSSAGLLGLKGIATADRQMLEKLILPSGFYRQKSCRLKEIARFFLNECGGLHQAMKIPTHLLREQLLSLDGIGPETADDILLYALDRPVFVVDEYTRRISVAEQISSVTSYNTLQELFSSAIRKDFRTYQDFHALIVINGKAGR